MAKKSIGIRRTPGQKIFRVFAYVLCIFLACLSLFPFIITENPGDGGEQR